MKKQNAGRFALSTTQIIMLSFLLTILAGTLLLWLPISAADGKSVPFVDALFTATTSTCVTGLVTLTTASSWSTFGHVVILLLIQIGGLGIITLMAGFMLLLQRKMGLSDKVLLQDAFNLSSLAGLGAFVKKVILGTFIVEGIGALLYMIVFVPRFGARGIWVSIFNAVSAFCNAGIDVIGANSLADYVSHPLINFVTTALIILGGLGFIVWWDVLRVLKDIKRKKLGCLKGLTLHSKIALGSTLVLLIGGALLFFFLEYNNPLTLAPLSPFGKLQAAWFQSVTTRTAGFFTISQKGLTGGSVLVSLLLMFIGGSPVGTAGGVKTVTIAVLLAATLSTVANKNEVGLFHRTFKKEALCKAIAVVGVSFSIMFLSTLLLSVVETAPLTDILYETVSATATVGLSRDLTPLLSTWGKLIIAATMYLGRVGPISLAFAFQVKKANQNIIKNPTEDISVG